MECLVPSTRWHKPCFQAHPLVLQMMGCPLAPYSMGSLSFYPEVSHGHSTGWCPYENLRCLAHIVPVQGEVGGKLGSFIEPVGSPSLCAYAETLETVQTIQRYRVLVMVLLLTSPEYPLCRHRTFLTAKGTDGETDPEEQDGPEIHCLLKSPPPRQPCQLEGVELLIISG